MSQKIRVAIAGVGNCASSFVQGLTYYRDVSPEQTVPGLMHIDLGGYSVGDIDICAAFDVNAAKIGLDVSEAIFAPPNNTIKFTDVPSLGVTVQRAPTLDGLGKYLRDVIDEAADAPVDVAAELQRSGAEVLICYLPVGSEKAVEYYAEQALAAGCAFVNCIPVFIASKPEWQEKFRERGLPIIGDDIKSQVGATIAHRVLTNLFRERGVRLDKTYQLNFGGNTDFMNMLERERLESKKISKTGAVTSQLGEPLPADKVHVGPSDYVPWLEDRKWCHIYMEGTTFGGVPLKCELKLEVWDSPNSAGVVIDAVRCAKLALDRGIGGPVESASSYFMKTPPVQFTDNIAREMTEAFIEGEEFAGKQRSAADMQTARFKDHANRGREEAVNPEGYVSAHGDTSSAVNGNGFRASAQGVALSGVAIVANGSSDPLPKNGASPGSAVTDNDNIAAARTNGNGSHRGA